MPRPRFLKLDEDRRNKILDAAKSEFAESGFEQASYNRIIERAGLSKGAMYYYFDDKLDLYLTVLEDTFQKMLGQEAVPEFSGDDFWGVMEGLYVQGIAFAQQHPPEIIARKLGNSLLTQHFLKGVFQYR